MSSAHLSYCEAKGDFVLAHVVAGCAGSAKYTKQNPGVA